jgi:PKHD-type hydroxylase
MLFVNHEEVLTTTPAFIVLNDVFSLDECKKIIEIGSRSDIQDSKIIGSDIDPLASKNIRQSKSSFLLPNEENSWIFQKIFEATTFINERYFQFDLNGFNAIQFTEYHQGGDYYDWHIDVALRGENFEKLQNETKLRKLSGSVILSSNFEYTGGEFYIQRKHNGDPIWEIKQDVGSIVFFPSFMDHKINKVNSGIRRSLVFWVQGPKFK